MNPFVIANFHYENNEAYANHATMNIFLSRRLLGCCHDLVHGDLKGRLKSEVARLLQDLAKAD